MMHQILVLVCFAAGVGVLAALYGVFSIVSSRTQLNAELDRVHKEKAAAKAAKKAAAKAEKTPDYNETQVTSGEGEVFDAEEWTTGDDDGIAYEVTLDDNGNLIRKPLNKD